MGRLKAVEETIRARHYANGKGINGIDITKILMYHN